MHAVSTANDLRANHISGREPLPFLHFLAAGEAPPQFRS
jgi:hypothetical protein